MHVERHAKYWGLGLAVGPRLFEVTVGPFTLMWWKL